MPVDPRIQAALDAPLKGRRSLPKPVRPPRGYAAAPGTGPLGKTCDDCRACIPTGCDKRNWICKRAPQGPLGPLFIRRATHACARFEAQSDAG